MAKKKIEDVVVETPIIETAPVVEAVADVVKNEWCELPHTKGS